MAKISKRFVESFVGDYMGRTTDELVNNVIHLRKKALDFYQECESDVIFCQGISKRTGVSQARRIYIRALPPYVEGTLNFLKICTYLNPSYKESIPEKYRTQFAEPMLVFRNRTVIKDSIKETLIGFGKISGCDIPNNIMGELGAQKLMKTFDLRDDLMHPKSLEGLIISDEQLQDADDGLKWYKEKFQLVYSPVFPFKDL